MKPDPVEQLKTLMKEAEETAAVVHDFEEQHAAIFELHKKLIQAKGKARSAIGIFTRRVVYYQCTACGRRWATYKGVKVDLEAMSALTPVSAYLSGDCDCIRPTIEQLQRLGEELRRWPVSNPIHIITGSQVPLSDEEVREILQSSPTRIGIVRRGSSTFEVYQDSREPAEANEPDDLDNICRTE